MKLNIGSVTINIFSIGCQQHPVSKVHVWVRNPNVRPLQLGDNTVILRDDQQLPFSVTGTDSRGKPVASFDNPPMWASSNPGVGAVTPSDPNGMTALFVPADLGDTQIQVTVTNNDGTSAHGTFDVTVVPGEAVNVTVVAGTPAPIPPTPVVPTA